MNTGIIASRYAQALLKRVDETGNGETVLQQVRELARVLGTLPEFRRLVEDGVEVTDARKMQLFETALSSSGPMAPELKAFLQLLLRNGRGSQARLVFHNFEADYYHSRRIRKGKLKVTAVSHALEAQLQRLVESRTGCRLLLETEVDPALIGGFVFEIEDLLLDASVKHQLEMIRHQFVERNRRIV